MACFTRANRLKTWIVLLSRMILLSISERSQQQEVGMEWRKVWNVLYDVEFRGLGREAAVAKLKELGMNWLRAHNAVSVTIREGYGPRRDL